MKNIIQTTIWPQALLSLALFLLSITSAHSVVVGNLYNIETCITDLSQETRTSIFPRAFDEVMLKVTSSRSILAHPEVTAAKENMDKYIGSYAYKANPQSGMYDITIQFNQQMIEQLLKKIGQTALGKSRPVVLLWLVHVNQNESELIGSDTPSYLTNELEHLARNYAIPLTLPLLDLAERTAISELDVTNFNLSPLQAASKRYNSDMLIVGKIVQNENDWNCHWQLQSGEDLIAWDTTGDNLEAQLHDMFEHLGTKLIARYGVEPTDSTKQNDAPVKILAKKGITLHVKGVKNIQDYARVTKYLEGLTQIKKVEVSDIQTDEAVFTITADGGRESLTRALSLDNHLIAEFDDLSSAADKLYYKVNS